MFRDLVLGWAQPMPSTSHLERRCPHTLALFGPDWNWDIIYPCPNPCSQENLWEMRPQ